MTQVLTQDDVVAALRLVFTECPLCGRDEGEPVAVGNDFGHRTTLNSFLVLSCPGCGLLYLNPRPAPEERLRLYPDAYFLAANGGEDRAIGRTAMRRLLQRCGPVPPDARLLEVAYGPTLHLRHLSAGAAPPSAVDVVTPHELLAGSAEEAGCQVFRGRVDALEGACEAYDLILLLGLEHCDTPVGELNSLGRLLPPGGRLVIVSPNAASASWHLFRGRHWAGYDFPRHRCLFGPEVLRRLAREAGLAVDWLGSQPDRRMWAQSATIFARDWSVPASLTRVATFGYAVLGGLGTLAPIHGSPEARGARLEAILRKPVVGL
jgi:SAM-dependent methyltransferase